MRYKADFTRYLKRHLDDMVEDHLEVWKDRYYRMSAEDVYWELCNNYDFSADLDYVQDQLGRELSRDEQEYFMSKFERTAKKNFYKRGYRW